MIKRIVIITYNILSPNLAKLMINDDSYTVEIMDNDNRLKQIIDYINSWIKLYSKYNLIICLQEVCEEWLIHISKLFNENSFSYLNIQHGRVDNGNMGVLIAYPSRLHILKSDLYVVGKHIEVVDENSRKASIKTNTAILAVFVDKELDVRFGVITYHMPCVPTIQEIGLLHCKTLYRHIKKFIGDDYWVLAGDFNMTYDSLAYKYMIRKAKLGCIWTDTLRSYPITNHAIIADKEFSGCIDYIFYKKAQYSKKDSTKYIYKRRGLICDKVKLNKLTTIIPNKYEPSDHIPILSEFLIL